MCIRDRASFSRKVSSVFMKTDTRHHGVIRSYAIICALVCGSFYAQSGPKPSLIIKDIHGKLQTPLMGRGMKPSVLFFITHDCPVANKLAPEIRRIIEGYRAKAQFTLVYADPEMTTAEVTTHQKDYNYTKLNTIHDLSLIHISEPTRPY